MNIFDWFIFDWLLPVTRKCQIFQMKGILIIAGFLVSAAVSLAGNNQQGAPDDIVGYYYYFEPKEKEYSQVEVYKIGNLYKGKVVWLKEPFTADGKPKTDVFNKNKDERNREIVGISIFDGLEYNKDKKRWEGAIYDPANGDTFKCIAWFEGKNVLKIKGYAGAEWMGINRTIVWNKEAEIRK